jgi:hypothetical protein
LAAAGEIGADHAVAARGERCGKEIEISTLPAQPMHANRDPIALRVAPFRVEDAVEMLLRDASDRGGSERRSRLHSLVDLVACWDVEDQSIFQ